jgi:GntR family transcriptional regulator
MKAPVPKYYVTKSILHARLQREFSPGEKLPSEYELCRAFGVSRATINQALALLEKEGVIRREQGRGTFYLGEGTRRTHARLSGLLETAMTSPEGASARVLTQRIVQAPPRVAHHLRIPRGSPVVAIEGVGVVDHERIMFFVTYVPHDIGMKILNEPIELGGKTIAAVLSDKYGVQVASAVQTIGAALADPAFASHLGVEIGAPLLEVERSFFDAEGRPVNFCIVFYRADRYRFEVAVKD